VARIVRAAGCEDTVVAAAVLHEVLEDTPTTPAELRARFGEPLADLVGAVTENSAISSYSKRKAALRGQVAESGPDAAAIAAADKLERVRSLAGAGERPDSPKLHHYRETLRLLSERYPGLAPLGDLREELLRLEEATAEQSQDERLVELTDGGKVLLRPIAPEDGSLLAAAYERLSGESRRRRFLAAPAKLAPEDLRYLTDVDGRRHHALIALDPVSGELVGEARWVRDQERRDTAEVAAFVIDDWQGRGVGTALLTELTSQARERGLSRYRAIVSADNRQVLVALARLGGTATTADDGQIELEFDFPPEGMSERLLAALSWAAQHQLRLLGAIARRVARSATLA
jgi:GNAT superfamily N-acetyltransferase